MVDLLQAIYDSEGYQAFTLLRRPMTVNSKGRYEVTEPTQSVQYGVVYPEGPSMINRRPDGTLPSKTLGIITDYLLRDATTGFQPDQVLWGGDIYFVARLEDWSHVAPGFIKATCLLFTTSAQPPPGS